MLTINYHAALAIALAALLLAANAQASSLCADGNEDTAITATTPSEDFTDHGDGTVTHHKTGLMWQRCELGQSWDGSTCIGSSTRFSYADALLQAKQNTLAGVNDWRMPNEKELFSIYEVRCSEGDNIQLFPNADWDHFQLFSDPSRSSVTGVIRLVRDAQ
ncbi:DUF1566 domain-containing protein [Vibrio cholerae]|nr:DUF1566 domain-containing protein [Vibrio cholerae]